MGAWMGIFSMSRSFFLLWVFTMPAASLRTVMGDGSMDPGGPSGHQIPHRRLMVVVYPALAVVAVLFLALLLVAMRSSQRNEPLKRTMTRRTSIKENRLLQRTGASDAFEELHPETTIAEDFSRAFTWTRMSAFLMAVLLALTLAVFGDPTLFALKHSVANVASWEACEAACHQYSTANCGSDIQFHKKFCDAFGSNCIDDKTDSASIEFVDCTFTLLPEASASRDAVTQL